MRWLVSLRGDPEDVRALRPVGPPEWRIVEEHGAPYLEVCAFAGLEDAGHVLDGARELMRAVNTTASVFCTSYRPVVVTGGVVGIKADGRRRRMSISETLTFTTRAAEPVALPAGELRAVLALRSADPYVADVLYYLHIGDWRSLSNAYETIRDDLGGGSRRGAAKRGAAEIGRRWPALGAEADRFRDTVNSVDAIGLEARHARARGGPAPVNPMSLPAATEWVTALVRTWLRTKLPRAAGTGA